MASEASVADLTPDEHVQEEEIFTPESVQDRAVTHAANIGVISDDYKSEKSPLVYEKNDEVVKDSCNETLVGNVIAAEKSVGPNPAESSDQASGKPLTVDTTEPVYQDTIDLVKDSQFVQPTTEIEQISEKQLELAKEEGDFSTFLAAETTIDAFEKPSSKLPATTIESLGESTGTLIYDNAESAPVAKPVKELEEASEVPTTAEDDILAGVQLIDKDEPTLLFNGSKETSVPPELIYEVELASEKVGSPEILFKSSSETSCASESSLVEKAKDMPIGAVTLSDVEQVEQKMVEEEKQEDKINAEVGVTVLETETWVSSEAIVSTVVEEKWLSEGSGKSESTYAALLSDREAIGTEDAKVWTEDLVNGNGEKDNVVPDFTEITTEKEIPTSDREAIGTGDAKVRTEDLVNGKGEKDNVVPDFTEITTEKEVPTSDRESNVEVSTKARILDPSTTSNARVDGIPDFPSENSNGISNASEVDHTKKEEDTTVEAVSKSDVEEQKTVDDKNNKADIISEVGITEDKGPETETHVSSEAISSGTVDEKWFSEGSEKLESSYAVLEAIETKNEPTKIEGLVNDCSEKDSVMSGFVENAQEKACIENSASDLETATEVSTKERNLNPFETLSASVLGSPEILSENSKVTSSASEISHTQEENLPVRVVSKSDAQELGIVDDKQHEEINAEVGVAGDKGLETETCVLSEGVISGIVEENRLSEGSEKLDFDYSAISRESIAKETEETATAIEDSVNDNSEKENVVPQLAQDAEEKIGNENTVSNLETSSATELLIKERNLDSFETSNASMVGSLEFLSEISKVATSTASEVGHMQEEKVPVIVVSTSDVQEQKIVGNKEMNSIASFTEDESSKTKTCETPEAVITGSADLGREKSESGSAFSIESESEKAEDATRITGIVHDESEKANAVSESVENGEANAGKEDLALDIETATEVLTKGGIKDLFESSNASAVVEITKFNKVDDAPRGFEDPHDLLKMPTDSVSEGLVIKEVVESSNDVIAMAVEAADTEVAPSTGTLKESLPTHSASLIVDNEEKTNPEDGTNPGDMIMNKNEHGTISSDVDNKISAVITQELPKDFNEGSVKVEAVCEHDSNDLDKEDEQKNDADEIYSHNRAGFSTEPIDSTSEAKAPKQAAPTKTRSPNMISKVKHTCEGEKGNFRKIS